MTELRGTLVADFSSFQDAVSKAVVTLNRFEGDAGKVETSLNRMSNSLTGNKIVQQATIAAEAVQAIGGVSKLTDAELQRLGRTAQEAADKLTKLGEAVPHNIQEIADAAKSASTHVESFGDKAAAAVPTVQSLTGEVQNMALGYVTGQAAIAGFERVAHIAYDFVKDSIGAYTASEDAQRRLVTALTSAGQAAPGVADQLGKLAESYQKITVHSDEAIKETESLLIQVGGVLPQQMDKALKATTDLSAGLGIDLREATMLVSKAFEDNFKALKKSGVVIDETRAQAEGIDYVLGQLEKRFGGQARSEVESYAGQIKQLGNEYDDLQEVIGKQIVDTGILQGAMALARGEIAKTSAEVKALAEWYKILKAVVPGMGGAGGVMAVPDKPKAGGDINLPAPVVAPDFVKQLADAQAHLDALTASERAQLTALVDLHGQYKDLPKSLHLTAAEFDLYKEQLAKANEEQKRGAEAAKKYAEAQAELKAGTLGVSVAVHDQILALAAQGQSEATIATALKLHAIQVHQVIDAQKLGEAQAKAYADAQLKGAAAVRQIMDEAIKRANDSPLTKAILANLAIESKARRTAADEQAKLSLTSYEYEKYLINQWGVDQKAAVDKTAANWESAYAAIDQAVHDKLIGIVSHQTTAVSDATSHWAEQISILSEEFQKLGQAAGGSLGGIFSGVGQAIVLMEAAQKSTKQLGKNGYELGGSFGPISTMFNENATSAQKWGATVQAGTAIASGAMDIWANSANQGSKAANLLGGTMAGAKAGAAFGPWGVAIGAAAGALTGFIRNLTAGRKAVEEFAKTEGGFDALHTKLGQLGEAGEKMWVQLTQKTGKGDLAGAQAEIDKIKAALGGVDEAFTKAAASPAGTMWDKSFQTLIADSEKLGMNLDKIAALKAGQIQNAAAGFASAVGVTAGAAKQLAADQAKLADVLAKAPAGQALDPSTQAEVEALNKDLKDQQGIIDATGLHSQNAASAIAGSIAGIISANIAAGESFVSAVRAAGPSIQGLSEELARAGLEGGAAFDFIKSESDLVNDAIAGPALTAIEGLTAGMVGLSNAGLLTQDMFGGLSEQISGTFQSLVDQGKDGPAILAAMQPDLQALWEAQEKFGYTTDAATQLLIDQAEAAGLVGEKHKPVNEQMLDALTKIEAAAGRIADALAGTGPGSVTGAAAKAGTALANLPKKVDVTVKGTYVPPDMPGGGGGSTGPEAGPPGFAGGTHGAYLDFGAGTPVLLHGRERVMTAAEGRGGAGGGVDVGGVTVNLSGGSIDEAWLRRGGARQIADAVAQHLGRSLGVAPV